MTRVIVETLVVLLVTPYVVHKLGQARYGLWALAGVLTVYVRLLDFGVARSLIKYVAEFHARKGSAEINHLVNTAALLYVMMGVSLVGLVWWLRWPLIVYVFRVPEALQPEALAIFVGVTVVSVLRLVSGVFESVLDGLQRMELTSATSVLDRTLSAVGSVIALQLGFGLPGLVVKNAVVAVVVGILNLLLIRRLLSTLVLSPRFFSVASAGRLFRFGANFQIVNLMVFLIDPFNKWLLGRAVSIESVGYYEIATQVVARVVVLFRAVADAIYPAVSELQALLGHLSLSRVYRRATRHLATISLPAFTLMVVLSDALIDLWLGPGYPDVVRALRILGMARLVSITATPALFIAQGFGRPDLGMYAMVASGILNLTVSSLLVPRMGFDGVIYANALAIASGSLLMFVFFHHAFRIRPTELVNAIGTKAFLLNLGLAMALVSVRALAQTLSLLLLAVHVGVYLVAYSIGLLLVGYFDADDRRLVVQMLPDRLTKHLS